MLGYSHEEESHLSLHEGKGTAWFFSEHLSPAHWFAFLAETLVFSQQV
jgi:hypothetical protein